MEKEEGEIDYELSLQELQRIPRSSPKMEGKEGNMPKTEEYWRELAAVSFQNVAQAIHRDVNHSSGQGPKYMPVLPLLPNPDWTNYDWNMWNSWYQSLTESERRLLKEDFSSTFSLLITKPANVQVFHACLLAPNNSIIFDVCVEIPQALQSVFSALPRLEGVFVSAASARMTVEQVTMQLANALSSVPCKLLVFSLSREILNTLGLDRIQTVSIRDLNRFPLVKSTNYISRMTHDLFITPNTRITIPDPFGRLMHYTQLLHMDVEWLDIPIPSFPTIKWVRYSISYKRVTILTGYCIVPKEDMSRNRAAFAVIRHMWGSQCPMLYRGAPSKEEMERLDAFIQCVCGKRESPLPQAAGLLSHIYAFYSKEFELCLTRFAPKKEPQAKPVETIPVSLPVPSINLSLESEVSLKRTREEVSQIHQPVIPLPDLTTSNDPDAKLILIVDIDLTVIHAIHDEESIHRFKLWLDEESSSYEEKEWKQALRSHLESIEVPYIDDCGNSRNSNLLLKIRPGIRTFLETLSKQYELIIYTQGEDQYARQVLPILDPDQRYFKGRYISRGDSIEPEKKCFQRILDCWNTHSHENLTLPELCSRLLIIDDKEDVWEPTLYEETLFDPKQCLVKCFPYQFFNTKTDVYDFRRLKPFDSIEEEYISRLTSVFTEIASQYRQQSTDLRLILRKQKHQVLRGLRIAFTSIIERTEVLETNILYKLLVEFGGVYVNSLENDCDLLISRNLRTAKVNAAQQNHIPVVSVRWLEDCIKSWKLLALDPYYIDFMQDINQTAIMGKTEIDAYHQSAKAVANTTLFTVTEPPAVYTALQNKPKVIGWLKDFDEDVLQEIENMEFDEKRVKQSPKVKQFSPSVNAVVEPLQQSSFSA